MWALWFAGGVLTCVGDQHSELQELGGVHGPVPLGPGQPLQEGAHMRTVQVLAVTATLHLSQRSHGLLNLEDESQAVTLSSQLRPHSGHGPLGGPGSLWPRPREVDEGATPGRAQGRRAAASGRTTSSEGHRAGAFAGTRSRGPGP